MENKPLNVLKHRREFLSIKEHGKSIKVNPWLLVAFHKNSQNQVRCGWTISKKVGSAVVRNRLKRWCREYFRTVEQPDCSVDLNVIFLGRNKDFFKSLDHEDVDQALGRGWKRVCHATAGSKR